jgi:hypothetical protein
MPSRACSMLLAVLLLITGRGVTAGPPGVVDLDGRPVDPAAVAAGRRGSVLVFTTTDCPISNRYAPELTRLSTRFRAEGVDFWLIYPVPGDTPDKIRAHAARFGLNLPIARDTQFALVKRTGVQVTPEVAVFNPAGERVYRGRVDDRYVAFGVDRPAPTVRDLEQGLTNLLAGRPIVPSRTQAIGCILSDLLR